VHNTTIFNLQILDKQLAPRIANYLMTNCVKEAISRLIAINRKKIHARVSLDQMIKRLCLRRCYAYILKL